MLSSHYAANNAGTTGQPEDQWEHSIPAVLMKDDYYRIIPLFPVQQRRKFYRWPDRFRRKLSSTQNGNCE